MSARKMLTIFLLLGLATIALATGSPKSRRQSSQGGAPKSRNSLQRNGSKMNTSSQGTCSTWTTAWTPSSQGNGSSRSSNSSQGIPTPKNRKSFEKIRENFPDLPGETRSQLARPYPWAARGKFREKVIRALNNREKMLNSLRKRFRLLNVAKERIGKCMWPHENGCEQKANLYNFEKGPGSCFRYRYRYCSPEHSIEADDLKCLEQHKFFIKHNGEYLRVKLVKPGWNKLGSFWSQPSRRPVF